MRRRIALSLCGLALGAAAILLMSLREPYDGFAGRKLIEIPRGTSSKVVAARLRDAGVIRWEWQFLLLRAMRPHAVLHAGEYQFVERSRATDVFDRIARGDIFYHELRVPEGSNLFDIAKLVGGLGWISKAEFLEAARDPSLVQDIAPAATSLEGYLFPSTYRVTRTTTAQQLCRQMTDEFRAAWNRAGGKGDVHSTVTLASLIEKETGVDEERPIVASVFRNRLERGFKLDCDPTTIYAALLEGRFDGTIKRSDLASKHPYNTYQHAGLPPGPIANPGEKSLRAALDPAKSDYIFFVAKPGSRSHQFSATLREHVEAVAAYRRAIQEALEEKPANGVAQ